jgi:hypothetical protein
MNYQGAYDRNVEVTKKKKNCLFEFSKNKMHKNNAMHDMHDSKYAPKKKKKKKCNARNTIML